MQNKDNTMLRKLINHTLVKLNNGKFKKLHPLTDAIDSFCFEPALNAESPPFIRDSVDVKRWMTLVIVALLPPIFVAVWNAGVQKIIYSSGNGQLMNDFLKASLSLKSYLRFTFSSGRYLQIIKAGSLIFFPLLIISYTVGGICEIVFAVFRGHKIAEGLLVTGILYPLTLPPTIPYWMAALGIAFGVIIGKEIFGGTGMNILNPALTGRAFLFFTFPASMTGDVWVGSNTSVITQSLRQMNHSLQIPIEGFTQATPLQTLNALSPAIKKVHVDAIAANILHNLDIVSSQKLIMQQFTLWQHTHPDLINGFLTSSDLQSFLSAPFEQGGLALAQGQFDSAYLASDLIYGLGKFSNGNLFWGNILGSLGETSTVACLAGAIFLIITGIGSWRTMLSFGLGAFLTAWLFKFLGIELSSQGAAWVPAKFFIPAYRHLMMGGLAFGLVYMATDPVSSPSMKKGKWIYGLLIGCLTIIIRLTNPAYPEGVMLAILMGNVLSPLIDYYSVRSYRKKRKTCGTDA